MLEEEEKLLTPYVFFAVSAQNDITGNSSGFMGRIKYDIPLISGNENHTFTIKPEIGVQYDNQNLNTYYFGISQNESVNSGLYSYTASDSGAPYEGITCVYVANQRVNLFLIFQVFQLPPQVYNNPMVEKPKDVLSSQLIVPYSFLNEFE